MTFICRFLVLIIGFLMAFGAMASDAASAFQRMIESDMLGDPSGRLALFGPNSKMIGASKRQTELRQVAFDLDADALEVATHWQLQAPSHHCNAMSCELVVQYRVVAITVGQGVPSWNKKEGREIQLLDQPIQKSVRYRLKKLNDRWVVDEFQHPYVSPDALEKFFRETLQKTEAIQYPRTSDSRVFVNQEVIKNWGTRQLEQLRKIPR